MLDPLRRALEPFEPLLEVLADEWDGLPRTFERADKSDHPKDEGGEGAEGPYYPSENRNDREDAGCDRKDNET